MILCIRGNKLLEIKNVVIFVRAYVKHSSQNKYSKGKNGVKYFAVGHNYLNSYLFKKQ